MKGFNSRSVIVNADDMGLHTAINRGIAEAYRNGIVTSASVIVGGDAFEEAVDFLKENPGLDAGVHLTLVEERPVAPASKVPSLINPDGYMRSTYRSFVWDWCSGIIKASEVEYELEAQVARLVQHGIRPSHLDSHQHVHCLPGIWGLTLKVARKHRVPFVRLPAFDRLRCDGESFPVTFFRSGVNVLSFIHRRLSPVGIRFADRMIGTSYSGQMTADRLLGILDAIPPGVTEILVHPGLADEHLHNRYRHWENFNWSNDLHAVTDPLVVERCSKADIALTSFARLAQDRSNPA